MNVLFCLVNISTTCAEVRGRCVNMDSAYGLCRYDYITVLLSLVLLVKCAGKRV